MRRPTVRERLFSQLIIDPSGCLLWTGSTRGGGYGRIKISGRSYAVHRLVYEMFAGPIPAGLEVDHLCKNRICCNVAHLEAVTPRVNNVRSTSPSAINTTKTYCAKGHEFDLLNTRFTPSGRRACRICSRAFTAKHNARKRAESGRPFGRIYVRKTHCNSGHEFDEANTYWTKDGRRQCRECNRIQQALRRELTSIDRTDVPQ